MYIKRPYLYLCLPLIALMAAVYFMRPASASQGEAKQWVIVFNQHDSLPSDLDRMVADAGGEVSARMTEIGSITAVSSDPDFAANMSRNSKVSDVSEDVIIKLIPSFDEMTAARDENSEASDDGSRGPTEPAGADPQPGFDNLYNQQWDKMRMNASATGSYAVQRGRKDVVVAILDTGVEITHPDIIPNLDFARSRSFVPTEPSIDDQNGHGSWCASAVAAPINTIGISGVAPNVTLVALKVLGRSGSGSFSGIAQALIYAGINKFDVASMSLGGYVPHSGGQALIKIVQRATQFARSNGVTPIAALGNDNFNLSDGNFVRSFIFLPAELPGVVGVSATGYFNRKAYYSNYGVGKTDVSAPGGDLVFQRTPPPYRGRGGALGAWAPETIGTISPVLRNEQCDPTEPTNCSYYAYIQGTSMATPNVAGVAALIISQYGDFTPDNSQKGHMSPTAVEAILQRTANNQPCPPAPFNPTIGPFSFPADCNGGAGYNGFFGKGIVDALKAVTE